MNPSIFISYSRDDQKQALSLLAVLRHEGYTVWIDQEAIPGASIWSDEIVQNIKSCDIFIALLSHSSVSSPNVGKEIGLAAEFNKTILPVEIGTVVLPGRLEYALAGIQRTNFHNEEAILHAIRKIAAKSEEVQVPQIIHKHRLNYKTRIKVKALAALALLLLVIGGFFFFTHNSQKKEFQSNSVVILPFATINLDQDSTRNLDIFSEAILTRLSTLASITSTGSAVAASYRDSRLNALSIAKELKVRYVIEGLVRKLHDVNFVSVRIFDAKKGGELWEQFYSGNNKELFVIREKVCADVFDFLHGVSEDEEGIRKLEQNITSHPNDASAYAELANRLVAGDNNRALDLFEKAIKYDSTNVTYYLNAGIVADRQKDGMRAKQFGRLAAQVAEKKLRSYPDSNNLVTNYVIALDLSGQHTLAERMYDSLLLIRPTDTRLMYNAACNFAKQGKADKTFDLLEKLFPLAPGKKAEVKSDPDFDNVRMYPRYLKLISGNTSQ